MKKFFNVVAVLGAAMSLASCGFGGYIVSVDHKETTAEALPFTNQYVMTTPVVADLEIVDTTMVEVVERFEDVIVTGESIKNLPSLKLRALTEAVKKLRKENMNVDVLLGVLFEVSTEFPNGKEYPGIFVITVQGYPARYTKFRTASQDDVELIWKAHLSQQGAANDAVVENSTVLRENVQYVK